MKSDVVFGLLNASWPVLLVGETGAIQNANEKAVESLGATVGNGSTVLDSLWLPENHTVPAEFLARCEASSSGPISLHLKGAGGATLAFQTWVSSFIDEGRKIFVLQLHPDKINGAEAGLAHKQKLDRALQLARSVSLDFNNALTSIMGHTSLVLSKLEPENPWRRSLVEVEKSASKAAEIANDLATFSRQEKEVKAQVSGNLNQLLQRNVEMFQATKLDKEVAWMLQLERRLFTAKFDEPKLQQALVKLMENAVESFPERGRIILQTKNIELTEPTQDRNAHLAAGAYVCAEISDNGSGIEAEILPRIFEPFFTTKRGGKHRGLGLPWVYGIVTNHGGCVAVSSQPGQGTSVRVYLPADNKIVRDSSLDSTTLNGTETILMVDDEDMLLTMGQVVLSAYGYRVLTANNGQKALEMISKSDRQIDLLITDLVMPNMSGRDLVEKVRLASPYTRILCSSGFVRPTVEEQEQTSYLQKPFTSQELLTKIRQVLSPAAPAPVD